MGFAWGSGCSSPRVSRPRWRAGSVRMVARDPRTPFALLTAPRGYRWRSALRAWVFGGARCGPIRAREPPRLQPVFAVRTGVGTESFAASGAAVLPGCGWWDSPRRASVDGRFAMRSAWALGQSPVAGCGCAGAMADRFVLAVAATWAKRRRLNSIRVSACAFSAVVSTLFIAEGPWPRVAIGTMLGCGQTGVSAQASESEGWK